MSPVTTKLAIWIQPSAPLLSRLHWCLVRSKPSRVSAWASDTATYSGPASTPYPSRLRVTRPVGVQVVSIMIGSLLRRRASDYASNGRAPERHLVPRSFESLAWTVDTGKPQTYGQPVTGKLLNYLRLAGTAAAAVAILGAGGAFAVNAYANDDGGRALPSHVFSPYFQSYTDASLAQQSRASGAKYLTMAFLQT